MKRILLLLLLSTISSLTFAQKALFDKYEDVNGVTTVYISKAMLRMMRNLPTGIRKTAISYFNRMKYEVVMQVREGGENVIIYEKRYGNGKNEFVLLSTEKDELSIINVFGNVSLKDIQSIAGGN